MNIDRCRQSMLIEPEAIDSTVCKLAICRIAKAANGLLSSHRKLPTQIVPVCAQVVHVDCRHCAAEERAQRAAAVPGALEEGGCWRGRTPTTSLSTHFLLL